MKLSATLYKDRRTLIVQFSAYFNIEVHFILSMSVFTDNFSYQINTTHERPTVKSFKCLLRIVFQSAHIPVIIMKI